jgi:hypothetical protein
MVHFQNILHCRYKGRALFGRYFPIFPDVTLCTFMCDADDANFSSTALSAKSLTVHRTRPSGVDEHASAISLASIDILFLT